MNVPVCVGVPLIVIVFDTQVAKTPAGNPIATPIPVAPVVVCVIFVIGLLIQTVWLIVAAADVKVNVFTAVIVAFTSNRAVLSHPEGFCVA